jgi:hypothetical protein
MTTITITAADVGVTVARNGTLSGLRYLVADRGMYGHFTLVDDGAPFDAVPRQIFNSDMLDMCTNANGVLQSPFGVCIQEASISFGNLTVAACPHDAVFEVDCTGALPLAEIEEARKARDKAAELPPSPGPAPPRYVPPKDYKEKPPPPPDPELVAANEEALRRWEAGKNAVIRGPSLEQIRTELLLAVQSRRAEAAAAEEAAATFYAAADARKAARAKAQAEATKLLKEQGLL